MIRIAFVGAGSVTFTRQLLRDIFSLFRSRLTKGLARYTGDSFTVPAGPFPDP